MNVAVGTDSGRSTVLAIEDHPLFCDGLRALFQSDDDFDLVGDASTGAGALGQARRLQPDIVLLDIGLPGANGLDLVTQLSRTCPRARIVVLTGRPEHEYLLRAMRIGVHAFIEKDMPGAALLDVLRAVMRGERIIGHSR
jgi:DNA-binding NarL/FixJ family response regulator